MEKRIRVTVWNENRHEKLHLPVSQLYPEGIHGVLTGFLNDCEGIQARSATLDAFEHGLTEEVLDQTDVLIWWGHMCHHEVEDFIVHRVKERVLSGMGLIVLHSGHFSKIFKTLMGTSCDLKWRAVGEKERIWVVDPSHPITQGLPDYFEIPQAEMYGEPFDVPAPDSLVFISWFAGGEVFRSGCCYVRGRGKIFYFRPGHETYPVFYQEEVRRVIENAVRWATPSLGPAFRFGRMESLEPLS